MKISLNWLKELLPGAHLDPQKVAEKLTNAGLEAESIKDLSHGFEGVVVGLVVSKEKHPQADRLSLCQVSDGKHNYSVVCGAPNVTQGKKYPFAQLGAKLPNGMEIKEVKIRGVDSVGMLCSAKELGLSETSRGILELEDTAPVGKSFAKYYGLEDVILEVAITPNRGDCLSHVGIAREVGILFGKPFMVRQAHHERMSRQAARPEPVEGWKPNLKVFLQDKKGCLRYCSCIIDGVKIVSSPQWLVQRLESLGIRSINNVVDATNYIMLLTGHPLHAFDSRFIGGSKIIIRKAGLDKELVTLDGKTQKLEEDDLVIADEDKPIALAGIIGGAHSEIKPDTTALVLEAACFNPGPIRKTAKRLGLITESSIRFEKGVPVETVKEAMNYLVSLILSLAGKPWNRNSVANHGKSNSELCSREGGAPVAWPLEGATRAPIIDCYPIKYKPQKITLRQSRLEKLIGIKFSASIVLKILKDLGLKPTKIKGGWKTVIPSYRSDLTREVDLIEEITRFHGLDKIPSQLPLAPVHTVYQTEEGRHERELKNFLVSHGFTETIHLSFLDNREVEKLGISKEASLFLQNPLSQELGVMRPSLLPHLLRTYQLNCKDHPTFLRLFELRSVFNPHQTQLQRVSGIYTGELFDSQWKGIKEKSDFFIGKGLIEELMNKLLINNYIFKKNSSCYFFHPGLSSSLWVEEEEIGFVGALHPELLDRFDIHEELFAFDLNYSLLALLWGKGGVPYELPSPYPRITRDLALVVDQQTSHQEILNEIKKQGVSWIKQVSLYDLYQGANIPTGKKSLTYSLIYENPLATLTDEEVNKVHFELVDKLKATLGVSLR